MSLETALAEIDKTYGAKTIQRLDDAIDMNIEAIPSGNIALDIALGVLGFPRGRIIEIYGPESSGKTTLSLHAVAELQKMGGIAAFVDAEHALDPKYAAAIGVDTAALLVNQPDYGEQALDIVIKLVESAEVGLIVVDSVAALTPKAEIEGDMGDSHMGLQARLMSQAMRKINGVVSDTGTTVIFINQLREKIGVMFGSPETTPGGRALKFYASQRLDIRRKEQIKNGAEVIGNKTLVKVVKNKVAPPFRTAEFDIMYGEGMSTEGSILDVGVQFGVVKKSGAWYYDAEGNQIGQGREKSKEVLKGDPDLALELYREIVLSISGERDGDATAS